MNERWDDGEAYRRYVGRWSRLVAAEFVTWLDITGGGSWLDIGCGAGDLSQTILEAADPGALRGVDLSPDYVAAARERISDPRASFGIANAMDLAAEADGTYDAIVSGLVMNFVPEQERAVAEMRRVAKPGSCVAAYVWDYAGKMELMRYFWDAVIDLFPESASQDEGVRFPVCNPTELAALWTSSGLLNVETRAIDVPTVFPDFDDYWSPFLSGQGPAPSFAVALPERDLVTLKNHIASKLPYHTDGSIHLVARAWAVRGWTGQ